MPSFLFSSEHVSAGHPDKLADIISDHCVDEALRQDPKSRVAIETGVKDSSVWLFGELKTSGQMNWKPIVEKAVQSAGFTDGAYGITYKNLGLMVSVNAQSPEINAAVDKKSDEEQGAGDQGLMFGYATDETETLMPLTYELARQLCKKCREVKDNGTIPYLRPDVKTQVTVEYTYDDNNGLKSNITPKRVTCALISTQHDGGVELKKLQADLEKHVIKPVLGSYMDKDTVLHLNPSGSFVVGGPEGDAGVTGRKIIVDTYGGWGGHGGGAFSGKDPSKVDRSAAYAARWVAKSIVAAKLAKRCLVQLAYAIGVAEPLSIYVDTYGTGTKSDTEILNIVKQNFKLTPYGIITELNLLQPIYAKTASYGHFGRNDVPWEQVKTLKF